MRRLALPLPLLGLLAACEDFDLAPECQLVVEDASVSISSDALGGEEGQYTTALWLTGCELDTLYTLEITEQASGDVDMPNAEDVVISIAEGEVLTTTVGFVAEQGGVGTASCFLDVTHPVYGVIPVVDYWDGAPVEAVTVEVY